MKIFIPIAILTLLLAGCGKKAEQTEAIQVENETESVTTDTTESTPAPDKDGVVKLPSGLIYKDKKVGKGEEVTNGTRATVHYKGWLDNGKVFDTSRQTGRGPFSFTVGNGEVIKGWDEGLKGMKVGGVRELTIPPNLGYGSDEAGSIPPNSTLHFEVELMDMAK
ncbi:MAG: FKBP-type peptidyl-prolyl cis-trans isomerase [Armatimonadota bacterium]|jgi:FKBP-type peptidyl-prolyl cis-trans isomerase